MTVFLAAALSFPTVLFTVLVVLFLVYSLVTLAGLTDGDALGEAASTDALTAGIPLAIFGTVASVIAWLTSFVAMRSLPANLVTKTLVGIVALGLGITVARVVLRPFRRVFDASDGPHRRQLVGRVCTIRSLSVSDSAGTAELGDTIAEVRCFRDNALTLGSKAIVYDYDSDKGIYHVGPIDPSIVQ